MEQDFGRGQVVSLVVLAVIAGCVPAVQPLLLGDLFEKARISAEQLGWAASAEALGMAIAATLTNALMSPNRLRIIAVAAALTGSLANLATLFSSADAIILARAVNGVCCGVMLWIFVGMLARAKASTKIFAIYVTLSATCSFTLASLLSASSPEMRTYLGYGLIASLNLVIVPLSLLFPNSYVRLEGGGRVLLPRPLGAVALVACLLNLAAVMAVWVYLIPLAGSLGYKTDDARDAISLAIGFQIVAGLSAIFLSHVLKGWLAIVVSCGAIALAFCILLFGEGMLALYIGCAIISFFFMFAPPFHLPFLIEADPSRRSATFVSSTQLLGMFFGPALAANLARAGEYSAILYLSFALSAVCIMVVVSIHVVVTRLGKQGRDGALESAL